MKNEHLGIATEEWKQMMPIPAHLKALVEVEEDDVTSNYIHLEAEGWANVCLVLVRRRYGNGEVQDNIELFQMDTLGWGELVDEYRLVPRDFKGKLPKKGPNGGIMIEQIQDI